AARARLGESLAPDFVRRQQRRKIAALLLFGAVHEDRRRRHAEADHVEHVRYAGAPHLLRRDLLESLVPVSAVFLRIVAADEAGGVAFFLPVVKVAELVL